MAITGKAGLSSLTDKKEDVSDACHRCACLDVAGVLGTAPRIMRIGPGFARFLSFIPGKLVPNIGRIIEISLHDDTRDQPRKPADLPDGAPVPSRTLTEVVRDNLVDAAHEAACKGPRND